MLRNLSYYQQVQVQLNVCNVKYGDFVVWTESGIAIESIMPDRDFYESGADKVEIYGVLPEIIIPHAQHERGKVIDRGVHIYIYIYVCGRKKYLNRTSEIDSPFQTLTVGLLIEFID